MCTFDHECITYLKKTVWPLIGLLNEPDGSSKYHEFFSIREDLFNRIIDTYQNKNIKLNIIGKYLYQLINKDIQ